MNLGSVKVSVGEEEAPTGGGEDQAATGETGLQELPALFEPSLQRGKTGTEELSCFITGVAFQIAKEEGSTGGFGQFHQLFVEQLAGF